MTKTTVINLFAGPGAGKSTFCAHIFAILKWSNISCEMALEFAKDLVYEENYENIKNQLYIFGQQQHRIFRLNGKVDLIITDSPLLNSIVYDCKGDKCFAAMVLAEHNKYDNLNFFINRKKPFHKDGRLQNEAESIKLDKQIQDMLLSNNIPYKPIDGFPGKSKEVITEIMHYRTDLLINEFKLE